MQHTVGFEEPAGLRLYNIYRFTSGDAGHPVAKCQFPQFVSGTDIGRVDDCVFILNRNTFVSGCDREGDGKLNWNFGVNLNQSGKGSKSSALDPKVVAPKGKVLNRVHPIRAGFKVQHKTVRLVKKLTSSLQTRSGAVSYRHPKFASPLLGGEATCENQP